MHTRARSSDPALSVLTLWLYAVTWYAENVPSPEIWLRF